MSSLTIDFLGTADQLGQPPVEDDDLAEVAQDHVLPLEVAVDDPARVGVGDGVTDECRKVKGLQSSMSV